MLATEALSDQIRLSRDGLSLGEAIHVRNCAPALEARLLEMAVALTEGADVGPIRAELEGLEPRVAEELDRIVVEAPDDPQRVAANYLLSVTFGMQLAA